MAFEHLIRDHNLVCPNCNWIGTYEEAAYRFDQKKHVGRGKFFFVGQWGGPICAKCGTTDWSSVLMPTGTDPNAVCNCMVIEKDA